MATANNDIRAFAQSANVYLWQIAEKYSGGMTDSTFSKKMRRELSANEKQEIFLIIESIEKERRAV